MFVTTHQWLPLKKETRDKLAQIFFIPRTGMTEVETDNFGKSYVLSDGYTNSDLQTVTAEKLIDFLGGAAVNETILDLWKRAIDKVEMKTEIVNPVEPLTVEEKQEIKEQILPDVKSMNTADNQLKCGKCPFVTGSARGLKIHSAKHNRIKVA